MKNPSNYVLLFSPLSGLDEKNIINLKKKTQPFHGGTLQTLKQSLSRRGWEKTCPYTNTKP